MRSLCLALAAAGLLASAAATAQSTMRIGLQDDPDVLDPARARTFVAASCSLRYATSWSTSRPT